MIVYTLAAGPSDLSFNEKVRAQEVLRREFDAAGVERIFGCHVSVTLEKDAWRLRMLRCWRIFS